MKDRPEVTPQQTLRLQHKQLVARSLEEARTNKHTRLMNRINDKKKQRFIDDFIARGAIEGYPVDDDDVRDANEWEARSTDAHQQIAHAYALHQFDGPLPRMVATDLLASDMGDQLALLENVAHRELSVELVLAHLEALGFGFPAPVAISIATRVTLVLLNRKLIPSPLDEGYEAAERAAIMAESGVEASPA